MRFHTQLNSLRSRLALLVALVVLPGLCLLGLQSWQHRNHTIESVKREATRLTGILAAEQQKLMDKTEVFLQTLAAFPELQQPESSSCSSFLKKTLELSGNYVNLGMPNANGDLHCNALPMSKPVNVADRPYIREAMGKRRFSVGEFQTDRAVGVTSINFAYPVTDATSRALRGAIVAVISLDWWSNHLANANLPEGSVAFISDSEGRIIAHYPPAPGLLGTPLQDVNESGNSNNITIARDSENAIVFVTRSLLKSSDNKVFSITIGIPYHAPFQAIRAELIINSIMLITLTLMCFLLARWWMNVSVLLPIRQLTQKSANLKAGRAASQTRYRGAAELVALQKDFDQSVITRLTAETKLKQSRERLRISESRFRQMAEAMSEVYWLAELDDHGGCHFIYVNPSFTTLWRRPENELYRDASTWIDAISPKDRVRSKALFEAFCQGTLDHYDDEFCILTPAGEQKQIHVSGNLITEPGKPSRITGLAKDVTDIRHTENALRRSQKMEAIGQLSGGIAHDFNNILCIIQGNLDLMRLNAPQDSRMAERLKQATKGVERATALTSRLLAFSRESSEEISVVSINCFIENLKHLIERSLTVSIAIETRLSSQLWSVAINPGELEDALLNLAINARDAMPDGGTLTIATDNCVIAADNDRDTAVIAPGDYVKITFTDTGMGIEPELQARIFEPFFTTKEVGKGTGLGLSMIYGFARRSGGYIDVRSTPGEGASFSMYLPRVTQADTLKPVIEDTTPLPRGQETVLVVDDEPGLLELACTYLQDLGYNTVPASSGKQALDYLGRHKIDLLFSDVIMPEGTSGYQLAAKSLQKYPELKILLTSGYVFDEQQKDLSNWSLPDAITGQILSKPYTQQQLALAIRRVADSPSEVPEALSA